MSAPERVRFGRAQGRRIEELFAPRSTAGRKEVGSGNTPFWADKGGSGAPRQARGRRARASRALEKDRHGYDDPNRLSLHVSQALNDLSVPDAHDVYPSDLVRFAIAPTKLPADDPAILAGPDFLGFEDEIR